MGKNQQHGQQHTAPSTKITTEEIREALQRSGYLLECRIEKTLKDAGYWADANHAYLDPVSGVSLEYDLRALNGIRLVPAGGKPTADTLFRVLIAECVNNPQPIAFFVKTPLQLRSRLLVETLPAAGVPTVVPHPGDGYQRVSTSLGMSEYHHYSSGRVATQYCSFQQKKKDSTAQWMAFHEEDQHVSFKKLIDAVISEMVAMDELWAPGEIHPINLTFCYPMLILQGELLAVDADSSPLDIRSVDHLVYQRSFFRQSQSQEENMFIDIVTEKGFAGLLKLIQAESERTALEIVKKFAFIKQAAADQAEEKRKQNLKQAFQGAGANAP